MSFFGIPPETAMLVLIRPISGSAALAVGAELMATYGVDSVIGRTAAVMLGSTETTFYTISVYFGAAGIKKHLDDFQAFLNDAEKVISFCQDMSEVFYQKCVLGLVDGLKDGQFSVNISFANPEVIFVFANHDPDSQILTNILSKIDTSVYSFPILIANASHMGYGLYTDCMNSI
jgi:hypothetical protein